MVALELVLNVVQLAKVLTQELAVPFSIQAGGVYCRRGSEVKVHYILPGVKCRLSCCRQCHKPVYSV
jgi:hypothetical protein